MLELNLACFPALRTERLNLRELQDSDAEPLFVMRSDDAVMEQIGSRKTSNVAEALQLIERIRLDRQNNDGITWALTFRGADRLIGTIGYYRLQKEHYRGEIGYLLAAEHWGKDLISEALVEAVDYGFNELGLHSIEAVSDPGNERSKAVLIRNGFKQEAHFTESCFWDGPFYDSAVFSKLTNEHDGPKSEFG